MSSTVRVSVGVRHPGAVRTFLEVGRVPDAATMPCAHHSRSDRFLAHQQTMSSTVRVSVRVGVGVRISFRLLTHPGAVCAFLEVGKVPDAATTTFCTVFRVRQASCSPTNNALHGQG